MIPHELVRDFERQMKAMRIGDTPLKRLQKIEKLLGTRRLHVKLEGENPTGTHKDRMALLLTLSARKAGYDTIAAATCGNYGASLLRVCDKLGVQCRIFIPTEFEGSRSAEIIDAGGKRVPVQGVYEDAIATCVRECAANGWYNANPGGKNSELGIYAYTFIAKEVAQALGKQPDWISVPVGNGTVLAGIWQGFQSMGMKPRMLGTSNNNAAVRGMVMGREVPVPVPDMTLTHVNDPLAGNYLPDAEDAIRAMIESKGQGMEISDEEMVEAAEMLLEEEVLDILPASASALAGIRHLETKTHTFVLVATARGNPGRVR
ncbi:MAG: pyridoxal-phosphate dependent enzyme [Thermoplasmata archaeon]